MAKGRAVRRLLLGALALTATAATPALAQRQPEPAVLPLRLVWAEPAEDPVASVRALGERIQGLCELPTGEAYVVTVPPARPPDLAGRHGPDLVVEGTGAPLSAADARAVLGACIQSPVGPVGGRFPEQAWRVRLPLPMGAELAPMIELRRRYPLALAEVTAVDADVYVSVHMGSPHAAAVAEAVLDDLRAQGAEITPCDGGACPDLDEYRLRSRSWAESLWPEA